LPSRVAATAGDVVLTSVLCLFAPFPGSAGSFSFLETFGGIVETDSFFVAAALLTSMTLATCVSFSRRSVGAASDDEEEEEDDDDDDDDDEETGTGSGCSALESKPLIP
jgi:hypothetical protein